MAYVEHTVVKPQVIADTGLELLSEKTEVLDLFTRENPDQFFGSQGDKVTIRVPGTLPARVYEWRNDRSEPIRTDVYEETTVDITVGANNIYNAVKLTDEQKEFDLGGGFGRLLEAQTSAIGEKVNRDAAHVVRDLPFELGMGVDVSRSSVLAAAEIGQDVYFNAFVDAGAALTKMRVPFEERVALVGSSVASELRKSQKLSLHQGTGNENAFASLVIGTYAGFTIVEDPFVNANEALVTTTSGIVFWNHAPAVPQGATYGATSSLDGISMRWLVDYDHGYQVDRSSWNTWAGFRHVEDKLVQINSDETQMIVGEDTYFLRGAKLIFGEGNEGWIPGDAGVNGDGPTDRKGADPDSELARVFMDLPFDGELPDGYDYPQVLATVAARYGAGDGGETGNL